jgi:hypothetical protein
MADRWRSLDFYDNLAAAADAIGFDNLGMALGLAHIPYKSVQDREQVLAALTRVSPNESEQP